MFLWTGEWNVTKTILSLMSVDVYPWPVKTDMYGQNIFKLTPVCLVDFMLSLL